MPQIAFIRHAPTDWNEEGRIQGQTDTSLSIAGRSALQDWCVPAEFSGAEWISSPLSRCVETAKHLAGFSVPTDARLAEGAWGEWEGNTLDEMRSKFGARFKELEDRGWDFCPPGGESPRMVWQRVEPLIQSFRAKPGPIIMVSHRGVMRAVTAAAMQWNLLGKPPLKMQRSAMQIFWLEASGRLILQQANVSLVQDPQ